MRSSIKPHRKLKIAVIVLVAIFVLYWIAVYFLTSAALVPSFMDKIEEIERRITVREYANQVQTDDIKVNREVQLSETQKWFQEAEKRKVSTVTDDGYTLYAAEFFPEEESHKWVLLLHGYTGWKEEMYTFAWWYNTHGYHVIVPDLRCQGESEGDFIGMGWTDHFDCYKFIDYMVRTDPDAEIVIHGQSMGAAAALIMSGDERTPENVKAIISDCGYTDAYSMFGDKATQWFHLPAFPFVDSVRLMLMARGGYDLYDASPINNVKNSDIPTLFIHGNDDKMISVDMAYELYDSAACEKELLIVDGAGHAQSQEKDPEKYFGTVENFIEKYSN